MTAIVAIAHRGEVILGGDSAVGYGDALITCRQPKVWTAAPGVLVGVAGDARACDVVRYRLKVPPFDGVDVAAWAARELADEFASAVKASRSTDSSCDMLLGIGGEVIVIDGDGGIVRPAGGYAAIGSGGPVALGALHATIGMLQLGPRDRVLRALEAAEAHCSSVRRPFVLVPE